MQWERLCLDQLYVQVREQGTDCEIRGIYSCATKCSLWRITYWKLFSHGRLRAARLLTRDFTIKTYDSNRSESQRKVRSCDIVRCKFTWEVMRVFTWETESNGFSCAEYRARSWAVDTTRSRTTWSRSCVRTNVVYYYSTIWKSSVWKQCKNCRKYTRHLLRKSEFGDYSAESVGSKYWAES
jgi:hypothetical protein